MEVTGQNAVVNPLSQPIGVQISTNLVVPTDTSFHFRSDKEFEKTNPAAKDKTKRPTFKLSLPLLTRAGLIAALTAGDKSAELAVEKANEAIIDRVRGLIGEKIENDKFNVETSKWEIELTQEMFPSELANFLTIAQLPKSERGSGISKEAWAAFVSDYKETMATDEAIKKFPDQKARAPEVLEKHGAILGGKFNAVRSRKDVIEQMLGFLDIWVQTTKNGEEHLACYEHLTTKGQALMQAEDFKDL